MVSTMVFVLASSSMFTLSPGFFDAIVVIRRVSGMRWTVKVAF